MPSSNLSKGIGICLVTAGTVMMLAAFGLLGCVAAGYASDYWPAIALASFAIGSVGVGTLLLLRETYLS